MGPQETFDKVQAFFAEVYTSEQWENPLIINEDVDGWITATINGVKHLECNSNIIAFASVCWLYGNPRVASAIASYSSHMRISGRGKVSYEQKRCIERIFNIKPTPGGMTFNQMEKKLSKCGYDFFSFMDAWNIATNKGKEKLRPFAPKDALPYI